MKKEPELTAPETFHTLPYLDYAKLTQYQRFLWIVRNELGDPDMEEGCVWTWFIGCLTLLIVDLNQQVYEVIYDTDLDAANKYRGWYLYQHSSVGLRIGHNKALSPSGELIETNAWTADEWTWDRAFKSV